MKWPLGLSSCFLQKIKAAEKDLCRKGLQERQNAVIIIKKDEKRKNKKGRIKKKMDIKKLYIRKAEPADIPTLQALIKGLAAYEKGRRI